MIRKAFDKGSRVVFDTANGLFFTDINNILCINDSGIGESVVTLFTSAGSDSYVVKCSVQEYIDFINAEVAAQEAAERLAQEAVEVTE
jgi:hypothetical protein